MIPIAVLAGLALQMAQNPSPMTEHTRSHERVPQKPVLGKRTGRVLTIGRPGPLSPIVIHFHGDAWLPEQAVARTWADATVIAVQAGSGSEVYQNAFPTAESFKALLAEAVPASSRRPIYLTSFSAGYGAVRAILRHSYKQIDGVVLMDGLHTDYANRAPEPGGLDVFLQFARDASLNRKRMLITHSEVFPGTFASTTETTDWLLDQLKLRRTPLLLWGPVGMQQLSSARRGRLAILGFAGNSAPDHVDHLHGMATWLRTLRRM